MYEKLVKYLTEDRLKTYMSLADNDREKSIELYKINLEYSSQLQILLSWLEVILRNSINNAMVRLDDNWIVNFETTNQNLLNNFKKIIKNPRTISFYRTFFETQNNLIKRAIDDLKEDNKPRTNNYIVSRLTFGFWTRLFNKKYEGTLWNRHLYSIFNKKLQRQSVEDNLNNFRRLRNRIAHNECILNMDIRPLDFYNDIISFLSFIDEEITSWIEKEVSRALFE
jgi:hypothetical protein